MILITGATGNYGNAAIEFLIRKGIDPTKIVALVRNRKNASDLKAKGVVVKFGDYNNYTSLVEAFNGVSKLLFISGSEFANRSKQHENVVKAAKESEVKHILYTSFYSNNKTETSPINFISESHLNTEKLIKESGITYTIFKNNLYMDLLPIFFGENVLNTGIFLPAGLTKAAFTLRQDMAEASAIVLSNEGHDNKEYIISNTENLTVAEIAKILSEITGKEIKYFSPSVEIYTETLTKAGVPTEYIEMMTGFSEAIKQGEFEITKTDLENLIGRRPTSAREFLTRVYS